jgi:broad specificity phosphatase PhoE
MLKNVTFSRHYQLEFPYDNLRNLNLTQYKALTEGKADPSIKSDISSYLENTLVKENLINFEIILTSELLRTKETAKAIDKHFSLALTIEANNIFNEIPSEFTRDLSEEEYLKIKEGGKVENFKKRVLNKEQKIEKLKEIDIFLKQRRETEILVISHSFLIGQLNYFYNIIHRDVDRYSEFESEKYEIGGYLKGFSVEIEY